MDPLTPQFWAVMSIGVTVGFVVAYPVNVWMVGPGERYDVIWQAREPGRWLLHCHIPHHTTNNNVEERGGGGLMAVIAVDS